MPRSNLKRGIVFAVIASSVLVAVYTFAQHVPLRSYRGYSLCGTYEKYYVLSGEADEYGKRVKFFEDYDKRLDPDGDGSGAAPAVGCPDDGAINLYLL